MKFKEFCDVVGELYDELPEIIKATGFGVLCEERPAPIFKDDLADGKLLFGYHSPQYFGNSVMMCYWGFKATNNFDRAHIARVLKHEFEHLLMGKANQLHKHSEHK